MKIDPKLIEKSETLVVEGSNDERPKCADEDENRLAAILCCFEDGLLIRLDRRRMCDAHYQGKARENGQCLHGLDPPQSGW